MFKDRHVRTDTCIHVHNMFPFSAVGVSLLQHDDPLQMHTLLGENKMDEIVDERCRDIDVDTVEAILEIAAKCTDADPDNRPSMSQVLQFLEQEVMSPCPSDFYESHSDYS